MLLSLYLQMPWFPSLNDLAPRFEQISISSTVTAMMILCILITTLTKGSRGGGYDEKGWKMTCNPYLVRIESNADFFCHDSTDGWKINHEPIAWQEWVEPIVHYFISKLTIPFAAPCYFQKPFTNSEPSCIKDGRKVITKGDSIRFFFSPSGHFQEFVYILVDIHVRGLEMYHVQDTWAQNSSPHNHYSISFSSQIITLHIL